MMNNYDLVIWDFNGTLMDDAWLCLEVMNDMLARRGLRTLSPQQYERYFDFPVRDYYRRAGWNFDRYPFELLSNEFMAGYHARKLECSLRPEAKAMLESLQAAGLEQAIISAAQQSMVDELLDHFGIKPYFTSVLGLDNHHAAGKLGSIRAGNRIVGATELEGADPLQGLGLEQHAPADPVVERRVLDQWRAHRVGLDALGRIQNISELGHPVAHCQPLEIKRCRHAADQHVAGFGCPRSQRF